MVQSNIETSKKLLTENSEFQRQNQRYTECTIREKEQGATLVILR